MAPGRSRTFLADPAEKELTGFAAALTLAERNKMPAAFNHTIIASLNGTESASFYTAILEADAAPSWGPFTNILIADGVMLQFAAPPVEIQMQHYAFLVDDDHFDRALMWLVDHQIEYWADPQLKRSGEINSEHGGRGVYFKDPAGHGLELITRPYL
jgi:catechol 2,3-dioxygenase-like lactoylglutathione lyase family enzyme